MYFILFQYHIRLLHAAVMLSNQSNRGSVWFISSELKRFRAWNVMAIWRVKKKVPSHEGTAKPRFIPAIYTPAHMISELETQTSSLGHWQKARMTPGKVSVDISKLTLISGKDQTRRYTSASLPLALLLEHILEYHSLQATPSTPCLARISIACILVEYDYNRLSYSLIIWRAILNDGNTERYLC